MRGTPTVTRSPQDLRLAEGSYVELVCSLVATLAPITIKGAPFLIIASLVVARHPDAILSTPSVF